MQNIVTISGSPSNTSRSSVVLDYIKRILVKQGFSVKSVSVRDLSPEDLLFGNFESPALKELQILIEQASGIIISTPIYKASYTGVLKALLDLMPQYAFADKVILPIATGGTIAHLLSIDFVMKPLFSVMGATHILKGVYIVSSQIQFDEQGHIQLEHEIEDRLHKSVQELIRALQQKQLASV